MKKIFLQTTIILSFFTITTSMVVGQKHGEKSDKSFGRNTSRNNIIVGITNGILPVYKKKIAVTPDVAFVERTMFFNRLISTNTIFNFCKIFECSFNFFSSSVSPPVVS